MNSLELENVSDVVNEIEKKHSDNFLLTILWMLLMILLK